MVSTPEVFNDKSPIPYGPPVPVKQSNARKSIHQFSETLDIKPKTDVRRLCAAKSKCRAIIVGSMLWSSITKRRGHIKINECVKRYPYNWILQHLQVVQSPISNYCLKLSIDGQAELQLVPKFLF